MFAWLSKKCIKFHENNHWNRHKIKITILGQKLSWIRRGRITDMQHGWPRRHIKFIKQKYHNKKFNKIG